MCERRSFEIQVTEQYVQAALTDLLKVTIDLPAWEANQKRSRASQPQASTSEPHRHPAAAVADHTATGSQFQATTASGTSAAAAPKTEPAGATGSSESSDGSERHCEETPEPGSRGRRDCGATEEEKHAGGARAGADGEEKPPDTGLWRLLYKGAFVPFPVASFGTDLALKGTKIANKRARPSPHTVKL